MSGVVSVNLKNIHPAPVYFRKENMNKLMHFVNTYFYPVMTCLTMLCGFAAIAGVMLFILMVMY